MDETLYFYDLETSGINPRDARIMQFAGQRTTLDLEPIGEPDNILVRLTEDILPDPYAIMITGITPQQTVQDGIYEHEFAKYFTEHVATTNTTIVGYNTIRFDNEFIRYLLYRNFFDPYEWSYKENVSTWDMLDVVRMTRALRPDGIEWPFSSDGKPSNKLEFLTSVNNIAHKDAHDALADVNATIAIANLIKTQQPKLFNYLYDMRTKQAVQRLVAGGEPFVYTSGRYSGEHHKTTVTVMLSEHPIYGSARALVYDLRHDPTEFMQLSTTDLANRMQYTKEPDALTRVPVKELTFNKCPAVAPLAVLTPPAKERISIDTAEIKKNHDALLSDPTFIARINEAVTLHQKHRQQSFVTDAIDVDARLYDGFFNDLDKRTMQKVRLAKANELADMHPIFNDDRLGQLLLLYKARQFPKSLSGDEQAKWQEYKYNRLMSDDDNSRLALYFNTIQKIGESGINESQQNLLQDLWYWGESIAPVDVD